MQTGMQQGVRQHVEQWLQQQGGTAENIRYRLLRGTVSVSGLSLRLKDMQLHAENAEAHVTLASLLSDTPKVRHIRLNDVEVQVAYSMHHLLLGGRRQLLSIPAAWQRLASLRVQDARLLLQGRGEPLALYDLSILFEKDSHGRRRINLHAALGDGHIKAGAIWQKATSQMHIQGKLLWRAVPAKWLLAHLGMAEFTSGSSDAELHWESTKRGKLDASGHVVLASAKQTPPSRADIRLNVHKGKWRLEAKCSALPLQELSDYAPSFQARHLATGYYSGALSAKGVLTKPSSWRLNLHGVMGDVQYKAEGLPAWQAKSLMIDHGRLVMPGKRFTARGMLISDADIVFGPVDQAPQQVEAEAFRTHIKSISFQHLNLSLLTGYERSPLKLPPLQGKGSTDTMGGLTFALTGKRVNERWRLAGKASLSKPLSETEIRAEAVPLVKLRPVLSEIFSSGKAGPELGGVSDLDFTASASGARLTMTGKVTLRDLSVAQAGDRFQAKWVKLHLNNVGVGLPVQHITRVTVQDWHYQAALQLLQAMLKAPDQAGMLSNPEGWRLDRLYLNNGVVSVGSPDDIWLTRINAKIGKLREGAQANMQLKATLGGGDFRLDASLDMFAADPWVNMSMHIRDSLPFFLGKWFNESGIPRLTRGRVHTQLKLHRRKGKQGYGGLLRLQIDRGHIESGVFSRDPMPELIGFNSHEVWEYLADKRQNVRLVVPISGKVQEQSRLHALLGSLLLKTIRDRVEQGAELPVRLRTVARQHHGVALIRLRERGVLSQNERKRLREMANLLHKNGKLVADLKPQLGSQPLDAAQIKRVRHTQTLIEGYFRRRGITRSRIFPIWPGQQHRGGGATGIRVLALAR